MEGDGEIKREMEGGEKAGMRAQWTWKYEGVKRRGLEGWRDWMRGDKGTNTGQFFLQKRGGQKDMEPGARAQGSSELSLPMTSLGSTTVTPQPKMCLHPYVLLSVPPNLSILRP